MNDQRAGVLFVCMGNICRSPTGEGVFREYAKRRGLIDKLRIDSAGTIGYHTGNPPDARMRAAAQRRGYTLEGAARRVTANDLDRFDLVVAMDRANYDDLLALAGPDAARRDRIKMLGAFLPGQTTDGDVDALADVPDPYYGGPAGFEAVLDLIESACPALLEHLLPTEALA
ncbi:MAG: low molecular weight protein-tyrosine-phosphatase [Planctomycetota bacterium]